MLSDYSPSQIMRGFHEREKAKKGRNLPPGAVWGDGNMSGGEGTNSLGRQYQLTTLQRGFSQTNTLCLDMKNIRIQRAYPKYDSVMEFILENLSLYVMKISKVEYNRMEAEVSITFFRKEDVSSLEEKVGRGIPFPGAPVAQLVTARRLDNPTSLLKISGAADWVKKEEMKELFARWGEVMELYRGTSPLSLEGKTEVDKANGWIWDGNWFARIKRNFDIPIPSFVCALGDAWRVMKK